MIGFDQFLLAQSGSLKPRSLQDPAPFGARRDGSAKGLGFFGPLKSRKGTATELAIGINLNGREVLVPALVPALSKKQINKLLQGAAPFDDPEIMKKITDFAIKRERMGLPFFAD